MSIYSALPQEIPEADVCIVGSGPVGIAAALAFEKANLRVVLLEAGGDLPKQSFIVPLINDIASGSHAPIEQAMCSALGGTSFWWGGRCVPLDDIDFAYRDNVPEGRWPFPHEELAKWYAPAASFFRSGSESFEIDHEKIGDLLFSSLEKWSPQKNMAIVYGDQILSSTKISAFLNAQVTSVVLTREGTGVDHLVVSQAARKVRARHYVLACGGIGTARLLLLTQRHWPNHFSGVGGVLGRFYMGHISGKIADLQLSSPSESLRHDFFKLNGIYVRRRLTIPCHMLKSEQLNNIAFWADNPSFHSAAHGNSTLSLIWMALAFPPLGRRLLSEGIRVAHLGPKPWSMRQHAFNVMRHPLTLGRDITSILFDRFFGRPQRPGFLLKNPAGRFALHYHGEHTPNPRSRVYLADKFDDQGLPLLNIDLQYREEDVQSVLRAHAIVDCNLRQSKHGHLIYHSPQESRRDSVMAQATDGFHQLGLTRMGIDPKNSVVDENCCVHGLPNLHLATSGVFPSAGQATPTFAAVSLALRLADHIASKRLGLR